MYLKSNFCFLPAFLRSDALNWEGFSIFRDSKTRRIFLLLIRRTDRYLSPAYGLENINVSIHIYIYIYNIISPHVKKNLEDLDKQ